MRRHPRINLSGECSTLSIYNTCYDRGIMLGMHPGPPALLEWGCLLLLLLPSSSPPFHFSPNHQSLFLAGKRSTPIIPQLHRLETERGETRRATSPRRYIALSLRWPHPQSVWIWGTICRNLTSERERGGGMEIEYSHGNRLTPLRSVWLVIGFGKSRALLRIFGLRR